MTIYRGLPRTILVVVITIGSRSVLFCEVKAIEKRLVDSLENMSLDEARKRGNHFQRYLRNLLVLVSLLLEERSE